MLSVGCICCLQFAEMSCSSVSGSHRCSSQFLGICRSDPSPIGRILARIRCWETLLLFHIAALADKGQGHILSSSRRNGISLQERSPLCRLRASNPPLWTFYFWLRSIEGICLSYNNVRVYLTFSFSDSFIYYSSGLF